MSFIHIKQLSVRCGSLIINQCSLIWAGSEFNLVIYFDHTTPASKTPQLPDILFECIFNFGRHMLYVGKDSELY